MYRNLAQTILVFAFDRLTNEPVDGDASQLSCEVSIDDAAEIPIADQTATPRGSGRYTFNFSAAETDGLTIDPNPVSSSPNVQVVVLFHNRTTQPLAHSWLNDQGETLNFEAQP